MLFNFNNIGLSIKNSEELTPKRTIELLQENGLLKPLRRCRKNTCRQMCQLNKSDNYKGGYTAYCNKCKKFYSITDGTFFEKTQIKFLDFFNVLYCWASYVNSTVTSSLVQVPRPVVSQYFRYIRDICSWKLLEMEPEQIGGPGHIIEIDKSVISKRKYNRGRTVKPVWILGMYDRATKKGIIQYVEKCDSNTLIPLILKHVRQGSVIWTDQWAAYRGLTRVGFEHRTVNHSREFKSATGICTNGVKGYWRKLKMRLRTKNALHSRYIFEYIDEFMWCEIFGENTQLRYRTILDHIKERYPQSRTPERKTNMDSNQLNESRIVTTLNNEMNSDITYKEDFTEIEIKSEILDFDEDKSQEDIAEQDELKFDVKVEDVDQFVNVSESLKTEELIIKDEEENFVHKY